MPNLPIPHGVLLSAYGVIFPELGRKLRILYFVLYLPNRMQIFRTTVRIRRIIVCTII